MPAAAPEEGNLWLAEGYTAELTRIAARHLNFTPIVSITSGFGSQLENGSWNGLVGVLERRVSYQIYKDYSGSPRDLYKTSYWKMNDFIHFV